MKHRFVGYGSLMSHESLKRSIRDKKFRPVIVRGYKRIFNLQLRPKQNSDVLNIEKSEGNFFNGVVFEVDDFELKKLALNEAEYNFEKIDVCDLKTKKKIKDCIISIDYFVNIDKYEKFPGKHYFILCRNAAYKFGKEFGKMWDETTYISDDEKVSDWLKNHKDYNILN